MEHLVIIGNGIAGVATARYVRKNSDMKITIISSETKHFFSNCTNVHFYGTHEVRKHQTLRRLVLGEE